MRAHQDKKFIDFREISLTVNRTAIIIQQHHKLLLLSSACQQPQALALLFTAHTVAVVVAHALVRVVGEEEK